MCQSSKQRGQKAVNEKKAEWRVHYQNLAPFIREPRAQLTDRQRLSSNLHDELPVKEGFDKVLAENGIPLDTQRFAAYDTFPHVYPFDLFLLR